MKPDNRTAAEIHGCASTQFSSRQCVHGTYGCTAAHAEPAWDRGEATQPVELYDEAAWLEFAVARNVDKGERLARRDADIALDLQVQYQGAIGELPR